MPLAHFLSGNRDPLEGPSQCTLTLSSTINKMKMLSHFIEDGDMPWAWPGANQLYFEDAGATTYPVVIGSGADYIETDTAVIAAHLQSIIIAAGIAGTTVTYNSTTNNFDIVLGTACSINWTDTVNCTARGCFGGPTVDTAVQTNHSITASYIGRPYYVLLDIAESVEHVVNTSGISTSLFPTLILHTSDVNFSDELIDLVPNTSTLTFSWYRENIPYSVCPHTLEWSIVVIAELDPGQDYE